jgi:hypothetical protein
VCFIVNNFTYLIAPHTTHTHSHVTFTLPIYNHTFMHTLSRVQTHKQIHHTNFTPQSVIVHTLPSDLVQRARTWMTELDLDLVFGGFEVYVWCICYVHALTCMCVCCYRCGVVQMCTFVRPLTILSLYICTHTLTHSLT